MPHSSNTLTQGIKNTDHGYTDHIKMQRVKLYNILTIQLSHVKLRNVFTANFLYHQKCCVNQQVGTPNYPLGNVVATSTAFQRRVSNYQHGPIWQETQAKDSPFGKV